MEVTVVNKTKNELEFEIHGASETLLGPLMNHTLANSNVEYASYYMGHIVLDNPKFYVRTKKGTPKASNHQPYLLLKYLNHRNEFFEDRQIIH